MSFVHLRAAPSSRRQFRGFTLVELLVVVAIIAVLMSILLPAIQGVRNRAQVAACQNQLRNCILAMHSFEEVHRLLPGRKAATVGRFSIHTEILPFIEQQALHDRLNFEITTPTITSMSAVTGPLYSTIESPSGTPFTFASIPETAPPAAGTSPGSHRLAIFTRIAVYNCPVDQGPIAVASGNSYCPIVTAGGPTGSGGARNTTGVLLEALWPASGGEGMSGSVPTTSPMDSWGVRMNPVSLNGIADGASNTIGMVERLKGWGAGGALVRGNTTYTGSDFGFLVNGGLIPDEPFTGTSVAGDNRVAVAACRTAMLSNTSPVTGQSNNDLSGSQWFQYTCHWLGCANTLGPPNSAVCVTSGSTQDIAESGIAPPSSFHTGGANCGFMDGVIRFITDGVELRLFHHIGTATGGETMVLPP